MDKKVLRVEIITEKDGVRECFCLFGEKAQQVINILKNADSHANIDNMLKGWEKVVVRHDDIEAKRAWE